MLGLRAAALAAGRTGERDGWGGETGAVRGEYARSCLRPCLCRSDTVEDGGKEKGGARDIG